MTDGFSYKDGVWHCEGVPIPRIADQVGTPFYVYSTAALLDTYRASDAAFADIPHLICYAVKANCNLAVNRVLADAGCGAEVVSGGELFRALKAGYPPDRIVFDGNGKSVSELEQALESLIYAINVDSENELRALERVAAGRGVTAPVGLRTNPDVDPDTHPKIATGLKTSKFGVPLEQVLKCCDYARKSSHLRLIGIHAHIGSQITEVAPFAEVIEKLVDLALELKGRGNALEFIDIGGGIGIRYHDEEPPTYDALVRALRPHWERCPLRIVAEPGRSLVGNAGNLVAKTLYIKETPAKRFVVIDAAMNDLLRPSLYDGYHEILPVNETSGVFVADVVGGVCEPGDYIARDREVAAVREGDLLAVQSAGAYSASMSFEYNSRPLVPEVLVDKNTFRVVRRRPTYEEMISLELTGENLC